jgi:hypothetical protein
MQIGDILNKLQKVKPLGRGEYAACCPAHEDKDPSLNLKQEGDRVLVKCQAGCATADIMSALGLGMTDLFLPSDKPSATVPAKIVATYNYEDEGGELLYQVVRLEPKSFRQRHNNGGGDWTWNMDGVRRVLYHLPDLLAEVRPVYLVEGEKDADALWTWGEVATTSPGGANNWRPEYANSLAGKHVIVVPDKDGPGFQYAKEVIRSLEGKAQSIRVIILPGEKVKDVSDWLDQGGDIQTLEGMAQSPAVLLNPDIPNYQIQDDGIVWRKMISDRAFLFRAEKLSEERTGVHARISVTCDYQPLAWSYFNVERTEDRVRLANQAHSQLKGDITKDYGKEDLRRDLDSFTAGLWSFHVSRFVPEEMAGDEIPRPLRFLLHPYILESGGTIVFAPPGRGKSYTGLIWAVSVDSGCCKFWPITQTKVLFVNLERSRESLVRRLSMVNRILGLPATRPLFTLNARGKTLSEVVPVIRKAIKDKGVGMIVLDSISRAGLGDLNENLAGNRIIDALSALCPTWLALGHTSRANEDHMYGSIMQDAGADICVQLMSEIKNDGAILGIGWQITKQNDIGYQGVKTYALEFTENGLHAFRQAKAAEFPTIESRGATDMLTAIIDWIANQDSGDGTASEVEEALGYNRSTVSKLLTQSGKFKQTRKVKQSVFYGVKV